MAKLKQTKIYGDLELDGPFIDGSGDAGTTGQMLSSTGSSLHNEIKITASDVSQTGNQTDVNFSEGVAIGNGKIVIGAPKTFIGSAGSYGAIYIYNLDGTNEIKVLASDSDIDDDFGFSVGVANNKIVAGAPYNDDTLSNEGAVYVYDLDGTNESKITASDGAAQNRFGNSVAIGHNKIVVGAPFAEVSTLANAGAVYVYNLDGTGEVKITPSDPESTAYFGLEVAIGDNKIVVGAPGDATDAGAVYVYDLDGTNETKITASNSSSLDEFGGAVAVGDGKIVVGAKFEDTGSSNSGAAYVYNLDGTDEILLKADDNDSGDNYGSSVAVGYGKIVVGADQDNASGTNAGAIYVYNIDGSGETKVVPSDTNSPDEFGYSCFIGDNRIVVGALRENSENGAAYVYELGGTNWINGPSGNSLSINTYAQFSGAGETNQDVHIATEAEIDWMNPTATFSSGTWSNNGTRITVPNTGIYLVMTNWYFSGTGRRPAVRLRVAVNGTGINEFCRHTYIRNGASHLNSSGNWQTLLSLTASDQISIMCVNDAGDQTPTQTLDKDQSSISIVQLA